MSKTRRHSVARMWPSKKDTDRCPLCVVCDVRLLTAKGKPMHGLARYCSDACRDHAYVTAGHTDTIRYLVFERDKGICAACGRDCAKMQAILRRIGWRGSELGNAFRWSSFPDGTEQAVANVRSLAAQLGAAFERRATELNGGKQSHCWEADHIIPVAEGGGGCGLEGYRTLCLECHRAETRRLAARLAAKRRPSAATQPATRQLDLF